MVKGYLMQHYSEKAFIVVGHQSAWCPEQLVGSVLNPKHPVIKASSLVWEH